MAAMSKHLTPVDVCEALFGGPGGIADVLDLSDKVGFHWRRGNARRQAGDIPSAEYMRRLLRAARRLGIALTAEHLLFGMTNNELEQLQALKPQLAAE